MEEKEEQLKIISYAKGMRKPGTIRFLEASAKWGPQPVLLVRIYHKNKLNLIVTN